MTKLASEKASDLEDMTRWRVSAIREKFEGIINAIDASEKNEESDGLLCLACRHMKGNVITYIIVSIELHHKKKQCFPLSRCHTLFKNCHYSCIIREYLYCFHKK